MQVLGTKQHCFIADCMRHVDLPLQYQAMADLPNAPPPAANSIMPTAEGSAAAAAEPAQETATNTDEGMTSLEMAHMQVVLAASQVEAASSVQLQ